MIYHNQYRPKHKVKKAQLDTVRAESRTYASSTETHSTTRRSDQQTSNAMRCMTTLRTSDAAIACLAI